MWRNIGVVAALLFTLSMVSLTDLNKTRGQDETAIIGSTLPPVPLGTASVPELGLTVSIVDGRFELRSLRLPRDPMLISVEVRAEGFSPTTLANYFALSSGVTANVTVPLTRGSAPVFADPCPDLLAHPQDQSAAQQLHAQLCAELVALPSTGSALRHGRGSVFAPALTLAAGGLLMALAPLLRRH